MSTEERKAWCLTEAAAIERDLPMQSTDELQPIAVFLPETLRRLATGVDHAAAAAGDA